MKAVLLISGGIDSPVAGHIARNKKFELIALNFHSEFWGSEQKAKAKKLSKKIGIKKFISIDITDVLKEILSKCDKKYYFVLMKRIMYRLAEKVAEKNKCDFIITGENLGQVSSQTLQNLNTINKSVKIPVIRPLIALDKMEIVKLAEKIGTFDVSKGPEMCDVFAPKHPSTQSREEIILSEERKVSINNLLDKILKNST